MEPSKAKYGGGEEEEEDRREEERERRGERRRRGGERGDAIKVSLLWFKGLEVLWCIQLHFLHPRQLCSVCEALASSPRVPFPAPEASVVGDVGVTLLHVQLQAVPDDEAAGADPAGVRPLAGVDAHVRLQVGRLGELLAALLAAEGPLARVDPQVNLQVLRRGVRPVTDGAEEAFATPAGARLRVPVQREDVLVLEPRAAAFRQLGVRGARHTDQFDPQTIAVGAFVWMKVSDPQLTFGLVVPHQAEVQFCPVGVGLRRGAIAKIRQLLSGAGRRLLTVLVDQLKVCSTVGAVGADLPPDTNSVLAGEPGLAAGGVQHVSRCAHLLCPDCHFTYFQRWLVQD